MESMKFKTKMYIGFGTLLLLMVLGFGIVSNMLSQINHDVNEIVKERYEIVRLANIVKHETNITARMSRDLILEEDTETILKDIREIEVSRINSAKAIESLEDLVYEEVSELVTQLGYVNSAYTSAIKKVIELSRQGQPEEATKVLIEEYKDVRLQLVDYSEALQVLQEKKMDEVFLRVSEGYYQDMNTLAGLVVIFLAMGVGFTLWVMQSISQSLNKVTDVISSVDYKQNDSLPRIAVSSKDEIGQIATAYNEMATAIEEHVQQGKEYTEKVQEQSWINIKVAEITTMFQGIKDIEGFGKTLIDKITPTIEASYCVFYIMEGKGEKQSLKRIAAYAINNEQIGNEEYHLGESLVGQCASVNEIILLDEVPDNYIKITSGVGGAAPKNIMLLPIEFEGKVIAVLELASFKNFSSLHQQLLNKLKGNIGITLHSLAGRMQVEKLLKESQTLNEELQTQSEELNVQQEELRSTNEKLEEQYKNSELKTKELEQTKETLEKKAKELTEASKYKSEFLANMSHELRTPLNSLLILAQMLSENKEGNLTEKQVEYGEAIRSAGEDLLNLINDILDLSKIESGKVEVELSSASIEDIKSSMESQFIPVARQKGLAFRVKLDKNLPKNIYTDEYRLEQILKNLLSNAFKFTEEGKVSLEIEMNEEGIKFSVHDTGIGIEKSKQREIFEAFEQADGTTSRKYGGTGLGLSISRELAQLLGGYLDVQSVKGQGSIFTLCLPISEEKEFSLEKIDHSEKLIAQKEVAASLVDMNRNLLNLNQSMSREVLLAGKKVLIVDDDMRNIFALTTALEGQEMQVLFAENGREAIELLEREDDIDLVFMDIMMPEMDGYEAMDLLRKNPRFKDIPIIALTAKAMKNDRKKCIDAGASDYISKPVNLEQLISLLKVWLFR